MDALHRFDHITYASLGIDPEAFYSGRFIQRPLSADILQSPGADVEVGTSRLRFLASALTGGRVLDVGCGSGFAGDFFKRTCGVSQLVGIDIDAKALKQARRIYDRVERLDLSGPLPFEDASFDAVMSMDVFGHIEFRDKDRLISEIHRVTKPGGRSIHGIECGELDYDTIDPTNPDDSLLRYVRLEGHVGIEPADSLESRWARYFEQIVIENAFAFSIWPVDAYSASEEPQFHALRRTLDRFGKKEVQAASICMGFVLESLKNELRSIAPDLLKPRREAEIESLESPAARALARIAQRHSGFVYLTCVRGPALTERAEGPRDEG